MKIINQKGKNQPDPYVIKANGKFYLYCTGCDGVPYYTSDSLDKNWQYGGLAFSREGYKDFWAPCVVQIDGKYYMYVSCMPKTTDDVHQQALKVAVSSQPEGPFTFANELLPPFSIDAHVVQNSQGLYIFYAVNKYDGDKIGTCVVVDQLKDPFTVSGQPSYVALPTLQQEMFEANRFGDGKDWYTLEGAFYFKKDGIHYCMYSGNCYMKPTYFIGYCTSRDVSDQLNKIKWKKHPADGSYQPLIATDVTEQSTGHNSVVETEDGMFVVYHGREVSSDLSTDDRTARICKLYANDGLLSAEKM